MILKLGNNTQLFETGLDNRTPCDDGMFVVCAVHYGRHVCVLSHFSHVRLFVTP